MASCPPQSQRDLQTDSRKALAGASHKIRRMGRKRKNSRRDIQVSLLLGVVWVLKL